LRESALEDVAGSGRLVHSQHEFVEAALQTTIEGGSCVGESELISSRASAEEGVQIQDVPGCEEGMTKVSTDVEKSMGCSVLQVVSKDKELRHDSDCGEVVMRKCALDNVAGLDEPVHPQHELVKVALQTTSSHAILIKAQGYSRGRGDEHLLQLFWQLIHECLLPARNANAGVQRALSANEVFKKMDKKGSGQITGREFQQAVVVLGMPLDADTISHIYGLIASGDNRLAKADFIKSFQAFTLKGGVRLMPAPTQPAPRQKQKVVQSILCFPFIC